MRKVLQRDRYDAAARLAGPTAIEDPGLALVRHQTLQQERSAKWKPPDVALQVSARAHQLDSRASTAEVGLGHDRQRQARFGQRGKRPIALGRAVRRRLIGPLPADEGRDPFGSVLCRQRQDRGLGLTVEATAWE